ncbi:MAG: dynamin family protein [Acutalibacteraceae bacterium]
MGDKKVAIPDFFKRAQQKSFNTDCKAEPEDTSQTKVGIPSEPETVKASVKPAEAAEDNVHCQPAATPIKIDGKISVTLDELSGILNKTGQKSLLPEVKKIKRELERKKFTVAVVGEFSKGKSTFINKLLGREFLPTGNLPTTAILTKIRYNPKEMIILFDYHSNKKKVMPLSIKSWQGLTADIDGNDPEGIALAGVNSPWLQKTGLEIEDTPGAGDLEEKRAKITGEALLSDDGAIITISATSAMSMSERLFIEQRLISQKTPYLMVIITKLDQVPIDERVGVIEFIKGKLRQWNREIPVFVPYDIELPDDGYKDIVGLDNVKAEIERWINDPERIKLTEVWLEQRVLSVMDTALASLDEQKLLIQADEKKREKLIAEKKLMLSRASVEWDNLRLEMLKRCSICYKRLLEIIDEHKIKITERLQYEAAHAGNPETWWKEDYPYRLKVEIMNMSSGVESFVTRTINEDLRWLNITLSNQFKTQILFDKGSGPEDIRKPFDNIRFENSIEFEDIAKKRNMVRAGTAALTAASYLVLTPLGLPYLVASLGIGTGSSIITEKVFKGKIENQKAKIKEVIAQNVPEVIDSATMQTEERLNMRYNEIIKSAREKEDSWMAVQSEAIENSVKTLNPKCEEILDSNIADIKSLYSRIQKY